MAENLLNTLRADCANCFGLCCVALPFTKSADFPITKAAGDACVNLGADFRCGIHDRLRPEGFKGSAVFDCQGAGQQVAQVTFGGVSWLAAPETASAMFASLIVMRQLHEMLWYLAQALSYPAAIIVAGEVRSHLDRINRLTLSAPDDLLGIDVAAHRGDVAAALRRASELTRSGVKRVPGGQRPPKGLREGGDLIGVDLAGVDLSGLDLRGAYLIASDLSAARLDRTDLIGADLRDANLAGADLSTTLFLTQMQVNSARGDAATRLPASILRPSHWG
jgi:hypothetical protein